MFVRKKTYDDLMELCREQAAQHRDEISGMKLRQDEILKEIGVLKAENESLRQDSWKLYQAKKSANLFVVRRDLMGELKMPQIVAQVTEGVAICRGWI